MLQLPGCRYIMIHPYIAWFGMIHPLSKPFTLRTLLRQFGIMSILKWRTRYESVWSREDKLLSRYLESGSGMIWEQEYEEYACSPYMPYAIHAIIAWANRSTCLFCHDRHPNAHMHTDISYCWTHLSISILYIQIRRFIKIAILSCANV